MRAEHSLTSTVGKGKGFFAREPNKQAKSSMYYLSLDRSTFRSIAPLSWLAGCSSSRTSLRRHHPLSCHSCLGGERGASRLPYSFLSAFRAPPPPLFPLQKQQRGLPSILPSQRRLLPAAAYRPPFLLLIFDASSREGGRISSTMTSSSSSSSSVVATANQPRIRQCQVRDVVKRENSRIAAAASRDDRRDERSRSGRAGRQSRPPMR